MALRQGRLPRQISPEEYPALEQLRRHCLKDGKALYDRVYAEALQLWDTLQMYQEEPAPAPQPQPVGEDLL